MLQVSEDYVLDEPLDFSTKPNPNVSDYLKAVPMTLQTEAKGRGSLGDISVDVTAHDDLSEDIGSDRPMKTAKR